MLTVHGAARQIWINDVRFGSKADIARCQADVRFTPKSRHRRALSPCPLCAKSGHSALRQRLALFNHLVGAGKQYRRNVEVK